MLFIDEFILRGFRDGTTYTFILSSLGFAGTVLLGVFSGHLLRGGLAPGKKVAALILLGVLCLGLGWAWSGDWLGAWRCPLVKHLFSSSMVLWSCGWCYLLLALFYLVIDVLGFRKWSFFFVVIGANAIVAYMSHSVARCVRQAATSLVGGAASKLTASDFGWLKMLGNELPTVVAFAILWIILWYMYRNKTFIRV